MADDSDPVAVPLFGNHPRVRTDNVHALISHAHAADVLRHKWYLGSDGYAFTIEPHRRVALHHFVWERVCGHVAPFTTADGAPAHIDHINRDRLDNRAENLRAVTPMENAWNRTHANDDTSCIRACKNGTFSVSLVRNGQRITRGGIATREDAKAIRDAYRNA